MSTQPTIERPYKAVRMSPQYHDRLARLAKTFEIEPNDKDLMEFLIDGELSRRGIDPATLQPKAAHAPSA